MSRGSSSSSSRATSMRLVSAPLEVLGACISSSQRQERDAGQHDSGTGRSDGIALHAVPSDHPHVHGATNQAASTSSCQTRHTLVTATASSTQAGIIEIRTFRTDSTRANAAPHQILLPAPVLEGIHVSSSSAGGDNVILCACTATGWAYRIHLPLGMLHSIEDVPQRWISVHPIAAVAGHDVSSMVHKKILTHCHVSDDGALILVSCADGRIIKLVWDEQESGHESHSGSLVGLWAESALHAQTLFSRFFGRGSQHSSPSQILSMTTYARSSHWSGTLAFVVSYDRKLRVWDLGTDACIRVIDLPTAATRQGAGAGTEEELDSRPKDTPRPQDTDQPGSVKHSKVKIFSPAKHDNTGAYAMYIVVCMTSQARESDFLACYGVQLTSVSASSSRQFAGSLGDTDLLWRKDCGILKASQTDSDLRDILVTFDGNTFSVWCLWSLAGRAFLKRLKSTSARAIQDEKQWHWQTAHLPCSYSPLQGVALDDDMSALSSADEIPAFITYRIMEPTRFSRATLEYALEAYEDILAARKTEYEHLLPASFEHATLEDQMASLVGITVELQLDRASGAPRHDAYFAEVKREWSIFVGLLYENDSRERWPVGLIKSEGKGRSETALMISSAFLSLPTTEDDLSSIRRRVQQERFRENETFAYSTLRAAQIFDTEVHSSTWSSFEDDLISNIKTQPSLPIEILALDAWDAHLASIFPSEIGEDPLFDEVSPEQHLEGMAELLDLVKRADLPRFPAGRQSELEAALASDAVCQMMSDRLHTVRLLLHFAIGHRAGVFGGVQAQDEQLERLVLESTIALHSYRAFDYAAHKSADSATREPEAVSTDEDSDADAVETQMKGLHFGNREKTSLDADRAVASNLVHLGILRGHLSGTSQLAGGVDETVKALVFASMNAIAPSPSQGSIDSDDCAVLFADRTLKEGLSAEALSFLNFFPINLPLRYIAARANLHLDNLDAAADDFESVAEALSSLTGGPDGAMPGELQALSQILPSAALKYVYRDRKVLRFYRRVISGFQQARSPAHVAEFSHKAIRLLKASGEISTEVMRTLHLSLFQSNLMLWRFDEAFMQLIVIPFDDLQRECLRSLISVMCEKGFVEQLLSFNFAGIQSEVERTLSFKARNSDPLADGLNYYDVLYAFHLRRGDLKSAGATMWQMGKRVNDLARRLALPAKNARLDHALSTDNDIKHQFVILEAQCFLKSINVLSLIAPADAWFAYEMSGIEDAELVESSKLTSFIPKSSFHKEAHEIRIVYLDDIRRHYQILVAYLELSSTWSEHLIPAPRGTSGTASALAMLFLQTQDFERAFTFARSVQVPRDQLYTTLTDKCLELSKWAEIRKKGSGSSSGELSGHDLHPSICALLDDDDGTEMGDNALTTGGFDKPNLRFLERADRTVNWTGPPEQRAWRYLRFWLSMEVGQDTSRYRTLVFEHILARAMKSLTPQWLLIWLRRNRPDTLIKSLLEHEHIIDALEESIAMVKGTTDLAVLAAKPPRTNKTPVHAGSIWLPYLVIDELLQKAEAVGQANHLNGAAGPSSSDYSQRRQLSAQLRQAIDAHKAALNRIEADERRSLLDAEARAQRFDNQASAQRAHRAQEQSEDIAMN